MARTFQDPGNRGQTTVLRDPSGGAARLFRDLADRGAARIFAEPPAVPPLVPPLTWDEIPGLWDSILGDFDDAGDV